MNCRSFRKFAGAFADGELDTQLNAEALEHLYMCPACAQRVVWVQRLKESLVRVLGLEKAPAGLADQIRRSIRPENAPVTQPAHRLRFRFFVPMSMAAALVGAVMIWQWQSGPTVVPIQTGSATVIQTHLGKEAQTQHNRCAMRARNDNHHDPSLGRDPAEITQKLTRDLKLAVMAPDLTEQGFRLLGADRCGMMGRPGAHILYEDQDGRLLSVFSITLGECGGVSFGTPSSDGGFDFSAERLDGLSVVAWTEGCATYVFCSEITQQQLVDAAGAARSAAGDNR